MKIWLCVISFFVLTTGSGDDIFAQETPQYLEKYKSGLPPRGSTVELEDHKSNLPKPKGRKITNTPFEFNADPSLLTDEMIRSLRQEAMTNNAVRRALGQRYAFTTAGRTELEKGKLHDASRSRATLRFYSYSKNRAVDIQMSDRAVIRVIPKRRGYQPPESREEVNAAAEIVRSDGRYRGDVADLFVQGIWTPSQNGNRYLYLLFYKGKGMEKGPAVFEAVVDMTAGKIVSARRVRRET